MSSEIRVFFTGGGRRYPVNGSLIISKRGSTMMNGFVPYDMFKGLIPVD